MRTGRLRVANDLTDTSFDLRERTRPDERLVDTAYEVANPFKFSSALIGAVLFDGVFDTVCEEFVSFHAVPFPQIIGCTGGDGVASDRFAPLTGKKNKREIRVLLTDGFEEFNTVFPGHSVVADKTVNASCSKAVERFSSTCCSYNIEFTGLLFEYFGCYI